VADLVKPASAVVKQTETVQAMLAKQPRRPRRVVYVLDANGELLASLDPRVILTDVERRDVDPRSSVIAVSTPARAMLTPDLSLTAALDVFLREKATVLPVIAGQWRTTFLGEVYRHDLLLALQDRLAGKR